MRNIRYLPSIEYLLFTMCRELTSSEFDELNVLYKKCMRDRRLTKGDIVLLAATQQRLEQRIDETPWGF